ncbi:MAG: amidase domain-containing protein [Oscillospiraceae bacterium]|nr:amidase domain-containing protein [Oscillospiraceae bacterium]
MRNGAYERGKAVAYAHKWAFGRNPAYYNFEGIGGDCTNFASQCVHAGGGVMNFTPTFGWYYVSAARRAPAWTGVIYFWNFLTRAGRSVGPVGKPCGLAELEPGDIIQLSFDGATYQHNPIVVSVGRPAAPDNILVAAHTDDADNRPLSTYSFEKMRCLHITGVVLP